MVERLAGSVAGQIPGKRFGAFSHGSRSPAVRRRGLLLVRIVAVAAALAGFLDFVLAPLQGRFAGEFEDYKDYLAAAQAASQHADIYGSFLNHVQPIPVQGFDYPPVVAWLLQPLAGVSPGVAATAWLFLLLGCTIAGTAIIAFELLPSTWPRLELTAIFVFLFAPATYNLWHGQMSAVVFLFLALALRAWLHGKQGSLGVFIGIAALIKIAPILFVVLMLRRRWWAACASLAVTIAVGVGGGIIALGFGTLREYVTRVLPVLGQQNGWIYNQSVTGALNRVLGHSVLAFQPSLLVITLVTVAVAVGATGVAAMLVRPGDAPREVRGAQFSVGILAMLLAGTVTWFWHLGALLIVLASVAALIVRAQEDPGSGDCARDVASARVPLRPGLRRANARRLILIALVLLLATGVAAPLFIAFTSFSGLIALSHSWLWWPALQLISAPAFAMTALFVVLVLELRRRSPVAGG